MMMMMLRKMRLTMMTAAKSDAQDCIVPLQDYYEPGLIRLWDPKFSGPNCQLLNFVKGKQFFARGTPCIMNAMKFVCLS